MERHLLTRVNKETADALGTYYLDLGRDLKRQSEQLTAGAKNAARLRRRRRDATAVALSVDRLLANQVRLDAAVAAVAGRFAWTPAQVLKVWQLFRRKPAQLKARRDLAIVRLAARPGWTNARLGQRFKLAPETISRIISRMLDQAGPRRVARPGAGRPAIAAVRPARP